MKLKLFIYFLLVFGSFNSFGQSKPIDYRPQYHYTPPKNWVNDPNGLVYLAGEYHLFYQYNPFGDKWGHMSWGHAVSKNLQTWQTLPLALPEYKNADGTETMIFSGCAVVDSLNTTGFFKKGFKQGLVAIYTSHIEGKAQHQSLAFSSDKGRHWQYYKQNPVLDIGMKEFRDPNVIWLPERKVWLMTVSKPLEYKVQFYESENLKNWRLLSEFGNQGDMTKIWECPSLFKVPIEGSKDSKWVLMVSSGHRQTGYLAMQYFVGEFDGTNFIPQPQNEVFYLNEGKDFYAAIPFFNLPKSQSKPIIIGWLNDWEYALNIPTSGFRGGFSVPLKLSVFNENGIFRLRQEPIVKIGVPTIKLNLKAGEKLSPQLLDLKLNSYRLNLTISLLTSKGFDLELLKSEQNSSILSYDVATEMLSFDRRNSGNVNFHPRFSSVESIKFQPENGILYLDILVDQSIVEIFANKGKAALTDLVFPFSKTTEIGLKWR